MSKMTIKDVAKYAGVSVSTVSNVINGVNKCSEETKMKILEAMNELEYKPNLTAKSLVQKKSHLIGVLYEPNNPSQERIIRGIESYLRIDGEFDFITMAYGDTNFVDDWVLRRNLDGLIIIGNFDKNILIRLKKLKKPIIAVDNYSESVEEIIYINSHDTFGAYFATEELIKSGVKEPFFLKIKANEISERRFMGYISCLEDYGIELREEMILHANKDEFLEGKIIGANLVSLGVKGLICTSDILALGVLKSLYNFKVLVPEEIKLIGFDNLQGSEYTNPSLTTVDTGGLEKGEKACKILINLLDNMEVEKKEVYIETKIIKRETV